MDWISEVVKIVGSVGGGGIIGYFVTRKKTNADAKGSELENVEHAIKIWRETAEKLSARVDELSQEIDDLRADLVTVHRENKQLKDYLYKRGIDFSIIQNESTIIFNEDKGTDNR
jgi:predicted RNase H-like nuclease (RuvC/YqgF family)